MVVLVSYFLSRQIGRSVDAATPSPFVPASLLRCCVPVVPYGMSCSGQGRPHGHRWCSVQRAAWRGTTGWIVPQSSSASSDHPAYCLSRRAILGTAILRPPASADRRRTVDTLDTSTTGSYATTRQPRRVEISRAQGTHTGTPAHHRRPPVVLTSTSDSYLTEYLTPGPGWPHRPD